jgi:hypothetical protein
MKTFENEEKMNNIINNMSDKDKQVTKLTFSLIVSHLDDSTKPERISELEHKLNSLNKEGK